MLFVSAASFILRAESTIISRSDAFDFPKKKIVHKFKFVQFDVAA